MNDASKAVVTVLGIDKKGIIARVSTVLFERGVNILDISQSVISGYFNMTMIVDITGCSFSSIDEDLRQVGEDMGLQIRIQRSEIFEAMYNV